jgi:hypothetical protein
VKGAEYLQHLVLKLYGVRNVGGHRPILVACCSQVGVVRPVAGTLFDNLDAQSYRRQDG